MPKGVKDMPATVHAMSGVQTCELFDNGCIDFEGTHVGNAGRGTLECHARVESKQP